MSKLGNKYINMPKKKYSKVSYNINDTNTKIMQTSTINTHSTINTLSTINTQSTIITHSSVRCTLQPKENKNILMLCTDLTKRNSRHIVDAACILRIYGFKVTIITCKYNNRFYLELNNVQVIILKTIIPESLFGFLGNFFYALRSAYAAVWTAVWCPIKKPIIIFCEADKIVLPILMLGNLKVLYFQYFVDKLTRHKKVKSTMLSTNLITKKCLSIPEAVLVPSIQYRRIFRKSFKKIKFNPVVMYPHIHTSVIENQELCSLKSYFPFMTHKSCVFLVLGRYNEKSNFELAVRAFQHLILIANDDIKRHLYLIVYGHYSKDKREEKKYLRKIKQLVDKSKSSEQFILLQYTALYEKLSLMCGCTVLMHTTIDEIFNRNVLEAMFLKKAVIASRTGFMKEVVKDGVTGFLAEPSFVHFAVAMNKFLSIPNYASIMGNIAHIEFLRRYSLESFGERLTRLVLRYGNITGKIRKLNGESILRDKTKKFFI